MSIINREIEASVKLLKKEPEETNCIEILIENSNFILKDLPNSFTIENKGVKFNYSFDYDYNYCRFLECAGPKLFFTFEELRPYLKDEFKKRIGLSN